MALISFFSEAVPLQSSSQRPRAIDNVRAADTSTDEWALFFGGPDKPDYNLRDVLGDWVDAQPEGGAIHFCCYYFRDPVLAGKLIEAHRRGVSLTLVIEQNPRTKGANDEIIRCFQEAGLPYRIVQQETRKNSPQGRLHSKVYTFSHPTPTAMIGSFNPSGSNDIDDPILREIGDQDRGHNLLFQTRDQAIVKQLTNYVRSLSDETVSLPGFAGHKSVVTSGDNTLSITSRGSIISDPAKIAKASEGAQILGAISHMKLHPMIRAFKKAARRRAHVDLIVHETQRRVPKRVVDGLRKAGVNIQRYERGETRPMHAKFLLLDDKGEKTSRLGSYNWNKASRTKNQEILLESRDEDLYAALAARFEVIASEIAGPDEGLA